jgi:hypothetical protein
MLNIGRSTVVVRGVLLLGLALASACSASKGDAGARGEAGVSLATRAARLAPGPDCAAGGLRVEVGPDANRNRVLEDAEVTSTTVVCDGADGASVDATAVQPGTPCAQGGVMLTPAAGSPTYVCNGAPGADGTSVTATVEGAGTSCPYGGVRLQVGAGAPSFACHGPPGADGASVAMTPVGAGTSCPWGGQALQVGTGPASYVCNGAPGADGTSVTLTPELAGTTCAYGGVRLQVGTGPVSYLCDGAPAGVVRPSVATTSAGAVRYALATVRAAVTGDGGELVLARGVVVAEHALPAFGDRVIFSGGGTGAYETVCDGLLPGTTYHVRAFATNAIGTGFGDELVFTTLALAVPALSTQAVSNVTFSTAISGGALSDDGGTPILGRGICWSPAPDPTLAASCASEGAGGGSFIALMTGLAPSATYHVRAYASNAQGTGYGEDRSFTTVPLLLATVTTATPSAISYTTASGGGTVVDDHGAPVSARGVCWGTAAGPTTAGTCYSENGGLGTFTAPLTGLAAGTAHHVRAFAVSAAGTSYGNEFTLTTLAPSAPVLATRPVGGISSYLAGSGGTITTDGGSPITAKGVCWDLNSGPTTLLATKTNDGSGPASFNSTLTGLNPLTPYFVRAYATNALGTSYGNEVSFTTTDLVTPGPTAPVVGTATPAMATGTTATSGGYVSSDGGSAVTARGVCWSPTPDPTLATSCSSDGAGVGYFASTVTGLGGCGGIYYVRAYATNSTGTGYGTQATVSTGLAPTVTTTAPTSVGYTGAWAGGTVVDGGGCPITAKGVAVSWQPAPAGPTTNDGTGDAAYASSITGLYSNRTYYVRAYATNGVGTSFGQQEVFTTLEPPWPYLGQSYAGGVVFYVDGTGQHGLVAAPSDQGAAPWGCAGTSVATGTAVGTGAANTAAMIASCAETGTAARLVDGLVLNGYSDWFLPSRDEVGLILSNLQAQGLGGIDPWGRYWTSSQWDASTATLYYVNGRWAGRDNKAWGDPVRAVRAF